MKLVSDFYRDLPFNYSESPSLYTESIRDVNQVLEYKDLDAHLNSISAKKVKFERDQVLEVGCGTGWLSNSIAYHYGLNVTAIDFTEKAISMANTVSNALSQDNTFIQADIFEYVPPQSFPLVVSLGVLHHTKDCKAAFARASSWVEPGGIFYVGLYHKYSRLPMLQLLRSHAYWHGENFAYDLFRSMSSDHSERELGMSWFRDQVLHPHETQHTIEEIFQWADEFNLIVNSTSINNYSRLSPDSCRQQLIDKEHSLYSYSYNKNVRELVFLPGYFTVSLSKPLN